MRALQGSEMAALRDDLEKAEELARKLDTNSKSMAESATVVNAARQEVRLCMRVDLKILCLRG
jgi:hypothetical protein